MRKYSAILFFLPILFIACTGQKHLTYFQDLHKATPDTFFSNRFPDYRIQKQDLLYVNIVSSNPEIDDMFATQRNQNLTSTVSEGGYYITGFLVNDSGFIEIPLLGKTSVLGKTLEEVKSIIYNSVSAFVKNSTVIVKLLSFKISILGEVQRPGSYRNYANKLTIFEAISLAGDITDYGNRKNVLILRSSEEGTKTYRVDLTNKDILTSDLYYLLPNDIIYVEPIKNKLVKINAGTYSMFLSTLTSIVMVVNFILLFNKKI